MAPERGEVGQAGTDEKSPPEGGLFQIDTA